MTGEEIEIDGQSYMLGQLDAMKQFHVTRRIAPVLAKLREGGDHDIMSVLIMAIGELSDVDSEYVVQTCLAGCRRKQAGDAGWAMIYRHGQLLFQDITMPAMLRLTWATLQANLADFFTGLRSGSAPLGS